MSVLVEEAVVLLDVIQSTVVNRWDWVVFELTPLL